MKSGHLFLIFHEVTLSAGSLAAARGCKYSNEQDTAPIFGELTALKGEHNSKWCMELCSVDRVLGSPREGVPYPGREILWKTSKLMPGGHRGFKQERPRRAILAEEGQGQRPRGKRKLEHSSQNGWKEARGKDAETEKAI